MNTKISEYDHQLQEQLVRHEGVRAFPYKDSEGILTIGIGRNLESRGLSQDEIEYLFRNDIKLCMADLDRELPWWRDMSENRQRVLVDMCFNLGITRLLKFKNTLTEMKAGMYLTASKMMLQSKWAKQVKGRAVRLSEMMRVG